MTRVVSGIYNPSGTHSGRPSEYNHDPLNCEHSSDPGGLRTSSTFPCASTWSAVVSAGAQDCVQGLRQGLQLLRPPSKGAKDGAGVVAGSVGFNRDARMQKCCLHPCR